MACFMGLYGAFIGLIFGIILLIYSQVLKAVFSQADMGIMSLLGLGGWMALFLAPVIYGIMFFLLGLIFTPLMNLTLKITKGIDLDIEMQEETPAVAESQRPNLEALQSS